MEVLDGLNQVEQEVKTDGNSCDFNPHIEQEESDMQDDKEKIDEIVDDHTSSSGLNSSPSQTESDSAGRSFSSQSIDKRFESCNSEEQQSLERLSDERSRDICPEQPG